MKSSRGGPRAVTICAVLLNAGAKASLRVYTSSHSAGQRETIFSYPFCVALPAEIAMSEVDDALLMPGPRIFADDEIEVPRRCSPRDRIAERCDPEESYPTPAEILVRLGALLLIFLWIASAADCLVDALGG